jgi:hypothetical protein
MSEKFVWEELGAEELVVQHVSAVAAYVNPLGEVVIRQEGHRGQEDSIMMLPIDVVAKLGNKLLRLGTQNLTNGCCK